MSAQHHKSVVTMRERERVCVCVCVLVYRSDSVRAKEKEGWTQERTFPVGAPEHKCAAVCGLPEHKLCVHAEPRVEVHVFDPPNLPRTEHPQCHSTSEDISAENAQRSREVERSRHTHTHTHIHTHTHTYTKQSKQHMLRTKKQHRLRFEFTPPPSPALIQHVAVVARTSYVSSTKTPMFKGWP